MTQSAVDRAAMAQAAQDIDASANVIKGLQTRLDGAKTALRANWEGNASMAFEQVFARFNEDFSRVLRALEGMHQSLVQTKITYDAKEEMSQQAVNKVQALLNGTT
ncbi:MULTISPECIES: WXG100 family type VII secretion target [Thermomonospora]|uniref:ESAT-6-like protein n=1 Tax=Thermomonospora cellulosilytica TaxID=1411118 RepID=A0A7W3MWI1_9ACTN|nr:MULTISPECIES: WXG100 family type VII secretion target [Thermomonospora]MBA9003173.1 WXG100 family type VII secretion target [Thermomonospora cellulosilytica]MBA9003179.1 WXG100 family type VII secretion target [Thermomonospora cellulosilytica]